MSHLWWSRMQDQEVKHPEVTLWISSPVNTSLNFYLYQFVTLVISGGSKGRREGRTPHPPWRPNSFNFMQFLGEFGKIVCSRPPPWRVHAPPWGNPGSVTGHILPFVFPIESEKSFCKRRHRAARFSFGLQLQKATWNKIIAPPFLLRNCSHSQNQSLSFEYPEFFLFKNYCGNFSERKCALKWEITWFFLSY